MTESESSSDKKSTSHQASIGTCLMREDGTILLRLRTMPGAALAAAELVYSPTHQHYMEILDHVGPLRPGERKPVSPWSDH